MLKAKTIFDVDKRPEGDKAAVVAPYPQLTESEREALRRAISPDYLKRLGMYEGGRGEILYNHSGMHEKGEKYSRFALLKRSEKCWARQARLQGRASVLLNTTVT